ncbi:MAG: hypothetical protein RMY28_015130 [Nostoc sp. ChiSLP01]|nr:hypothetical protein [Nostoc sp. CmiSLP01]MDZ8283746.1 hypothetical protein [Nostoc sp. ChiSLP01]
MEGSSSQLDSSDVYDEPRLRTYRQSVRVVDSIIHTHKSRVGLCVPAIEENLEYQQRLIELLQIKRL